MPYADPIDDLRRATKPLCTALQAHPLYKRLATVEDIRFFMSRHVFAVWDFMSLLKRLQFGLTGSSLPWRPVGSPRVRRLINEIVLVEESDQVGGQTLSHFEMYRNAMEATGASTAAFDGFARLLDRGLTWHQALVAAGLPPEVHAFSKATAQVVLHGSLHEVAGAFAIGRECAIPEMFGAMVRSLSDDHPEQLGPFLAYLERHVEVDGDEHGPMTIKMLRCLCGDDPVQWAETTRAAVSALEARLALWDAMADILAARSVTTQNVPRSSPVVLVMP